MEGTGSILVEAPRRPPIVYRDVHHLRTCRLYFDVLLIIVGCRRDGLFFGGFQSALIACFPSQALYGVHDILLLRQECVAEVRSPAHVLIKLLQHIGQRYQGLDAGVPRLLCRRIDQRFVLQIGILAHPPSGFDDFEGISGCHQYLAQDRVGIKGDWGDKAVQLTGR